MDDAHDFGVDPDDYCARIIALPEMQEWIAAAKREPDDIDELEAEF